MKNVAAFGLLVLLTSSLGLAKESDYSGKIILETSAIDVKAISANGNLYESTKKNLESKLAKIAKVLKKDGVMLDLKNAKFEALPVYSTDTYNKEAGLHEVSEWLDGDSILPALIVYRLEARVE